MHAERPQLQLHQWVFEASPKRATGTWSFKIAFTVDHPTLYIKPAHSKSNFIIQPRLVRALPLGVAGLSSVVVVVVVVGTAVHNSRKVVRGRTVLLAKAAYSHPTMHKQRLIHTSAHD